MDRPYWLQQSQEKPLFPDIEWSKPEQKSHAGRLGIIGGNSLGFAGVAESYHTATKTGVGYIKALLPDSLKKSIPHIMTDVIFGASNPSGGLARDALTEMLAIGSWASGILLVGDNGRNSETAILYEDFIQQYSGPLIVTRDAIDLLINSNSILVDRPNTLLIMSFAQLQKLFQAVYYPKVLTFSMQTTNLVENLHKFTITYPINLAIFHNDTIIVASDGKITTTPFGNPMEIWRGKTATKAAIYWLWNQSKPLESVTTSLILHND